MRDATVGRGAFVSLAAAGGYPEARLRTGQRRDDWFASYLDSTLDRDDQVTGKMLENFAVVEMLKHADWATTNTRAYHYRQRTEEIDLVLENHTGEINAVEVKAASSVSRADLRPMEKLRAAIGARFKAGVVLCTGPRTTPLGDRLWGLPVSGLWAQA